MKEEPVRFLVAITASVPEHMTHDEVKHMFLETGIKVEFGYSNGERPRVLNAELVDQRRGR